MDDEEWARRLQQQYDKEAADKEARTRFKCPLCLDSASFNHSVELDCFHRLCKDCFFSYLEVKIKEKLVAEEELVCPMPGCRREITVPQVEGVMHGTPLWERFLETRVELWKPCSRETERLCVCPKPGCGVRFVAPATAQEVRCLTCSTPFCTRCQQHHPGTTCEQFEAWRKENDHVEQAFDELMRREGWQRCPRCKAACVRERGCMYMTCYSEVCRGKTNFCYLCGDELSTIQHYTHFPYGLFENACEKVDRREEARQRLAQQKSANAPPANWWENVVGEVQNWVRGVAGQQ